MAERTSILLRLDPAVHAALARWASDDRRSTNAQIDYLLRRALAEADRLSTLSATAEAAEETSRSTRQTTRYSRGAGGAFFVMRTAILGTWVRALLAGRPAGTAEAGSRALPVRSQTCNPDDRGSTSGSPRAERRGAISNAEERADFW